MLTLYPGTMVHGVYWLFSDDGVDVLQSLFGNEKGLKIKAQETLSKKDPWIVR